MDSNGFVAADFATHGNELDVIIAGDMRVVSETAFRVSQFAKIQHQAGYRTGLLHVECASSLAFRFVNPEIDSLVQSRTAIAIDPSESVISTKLLVVETPAQLCDRLKKGGQLILPRIVAAKIVVVLDEATPITRLQNHHSIISALFGQNVTWAAATSEARASLAVAGIPADEDIWRVSIAVEGSPRQNLPNRSTVVLGRTAYPSRKEWPSSIEDVASAYPTDDGQVIRVLALPWLNQSHFETPDDWQIVSLRNISSAAFLRNLDYFVYFPGEEDLALPMHAMAWAFAHGVPVIADERLRQRLGKGPIYAKPSEVATLTRRSPEEYRELSESCVKFARQNFGPEVHRHRIEALIGPPLRTLHVVTKKQKKRILFTCTNGIGIGHVTRLLAVARRLPEDYAPVFAILSPAAHLVRLAGYPVEYIPSANTALCNRVNWNRWFREELLRIMDFHDVRGLMFDGGQPFQGLISAMRARPDVRSIWMRRGLWRKEQDNSTNIARQHFFDLVIEPGDIAESADRGATVANQDMTLQIDPVHLLDEDELLDRDEAAKRLGLDPSRPACLVQLGAGANRDLFSLMDSSIRALKPIDGLQIVVARWPIASHDVDFWPDIICIRGYPLSKYYRAFDFTISATGYNSFHEIITFGLPAIFLANGHMVLDDQVARAEFAQSNDAGFHLPESRVDAIGSIIQSIMEETTRTVIQSNCQRLSRANGAPQAASAFAELVG